jgi:tetratricopeptide (TPR) repeat protein
MWRRLRSRFLALAACVTLAVAPPPLDARSAPTSPNGQQGEFPVGEVVERVVSHSDSTQTYALYLPSKYRTDREWPVLYAMDPRGRALVPLSRFREAAERFGYIVLSSYNTASDTAPGPNRIALEAMLGDTETRLSADFRRLYLAGFSGTARASWSFAYQLVGHVAGVIGCGAGLPHGAFLDLSVAQYGTPFAFYGAVGTTDFNYDEMWRLGGRLENLGFPHRIEYFEGPHTWPSEEILHRALAWMELQAMRVGLRPTDRVLIDSLFASRMEQAETAEKAGDPLRAFLDYEESTRLFTGLQDVSVARDRAARLRRSREVRAALAAHDRSVDRHFEYLRELEEFMQEVRFVEEPPDLEKSLDRLRIRELQREAGKTDDRYESLSAVRRLESAWVQLSFYQPRDYMRNGEPARALALLEVAEVIRPNEPFVCYSRAQALAQLGRSEDAVEALECAAGATRLSGDRLSSDPRLAPLRDHPAFRAFVDRLDEISG